MYSDRNSLGLSTPPPSPTPLPFESRYRKWRIADINAARGIYTIYNDGEAKQRARIVEARVREEKSDAFFFLAFFPFPFGLLPSCVTCYIYYIQTKTKYKKKVEGVLGPKEWLVLCIIYKTCVAFKNVKERHFYITIKTFLLYFLFFCFLFISQMRLTENALRKTRHCMIPSIVSPFRQNVPDKCRPFRPITEHRLACTNAFCDLELVVNAG